MSDEHLSGFEISMVVENEKTTIAHIAKKKDITSQSGIHFQEDEHILKIIIGYDDKAIKELRVFTNKQKIRLGPLYKADFTTEIDKIDANAAIIGFQMVFSDDRIVEISTFSAPFTKKNDSPNKLLNYSNDFVRLGTNSIAALKGVKKGPQKPEDNLRSTFKVYKRLKKSTSY